MWRWLFTMLWPFCGWRPGRAHTLEIRRVLTVTYEVVCTRCGQRWMLHRDYPGALPWNDDVEQFFQRHADHRGPLDGGPTTHTPKRGG